ncbi:unnamed protein product [Orchesella dallaii]|uniref:Lipase domain-containing protein n=1 Tax=Orchesella dallaii TaxID=48710 RepID=A0ABP1S562_9HEXA
MKVWKTLLVVFLHLGKYHVHSLEIVPFGQPLFRLPENPNPTRDRSRYRHNYPINPIIRTAGNNNTFAPVLWDLASNSYPVDFFIYTKDNPYLPETLTVNNASDSKYFDKSKTTKFVIHDFMQSTENMLVHDIKDAYMNKKEDYNVIMVDWEPARTYTYTVAVTVSEYVGKMAARIVQAMKMDTSKVHVIGFGLGAHAAGVMGNDLKQQMNMTLARITGLDPSLPLFRMAGDYFKLDSDDAAFVDVIHTDGGDNLWNSNHLGMGKEIGHVDIYPNRGIFQPGCRQTSLPSYDSLQCSHQRALEIFTESINDELSFVACRCPTWTEVTLPKPLLPPHPNFLLSTPPTLVLLRLYYIYLIIILTSLWSQNATACWMPIESLLEKLVLQKPFVVTTIW